MSTIQVHVEVEAGPRRHDRAIARAAEAALRHQGRSQAELTVLTTTDERLRALNRTFRQQDQPTDVLAFPAETPNPESGLAYLGDIAISIETAERQARRAGHSPRKEILLLTVHGVLHLLGHDHHDPADRRRMEAAQKEILSELLTAEEQPSR